ncbi:MAG: ABC transporter permease [Roseivirga sp.]
MMLFFRWFCRHDLADAVEGDLLELYERKILSQGRLRANWHFIVYTLSFFQPFAFKRQREQYAQLNSIHMFYNNLKIGLRIIKKYRAYAFINILGLAAGLSAFLLMALFVMDELSYDRFHSKSDQIVRLSYELKTPNATRQGAKLPFPIKQVLANDYPEVEEVARIYYWDGDTPLLAYGEQKYTEPGMYFGESSVFSVFDFKMLRGNPETALADPRSIVLTERMATKYFGTEDPMGKVMRYKNEDDLVVTAVLADIPENSHVTFDFLLPIELQRQRWMGWGEYTYDLEKDWNWAAAWVYAELTPGTDPGAFQDKLQPIADEHLNTKDQSGFTLEVQPLADIHLRSDKSGEARANGNMTQVLSFAAIALLILFIACVNFINLTSVQTNQRFKEVGLRKVMGAQKKQLVAQFLTEVLITVMVSSAIALMITFATLPYFNAFTNKAISLDGQSLLLCLALIAFVLLITILSSLRPVVLVLRLKAVQGLANRFGAFKSRQRFSKSMVIGQFMVSNLLIIGILIVNSQLSYLQNKDLGFDKENMVLLKLAKNLSQSQFELFENGLAANPAVKNINRGYVAGTRAYTNTFKIVDGGNDDSYSLGIKWVGTGFLDMYGLKVIGGRDFDETVQEEIKSGVLINESAVKALGWEVAESVGRSLSFLPGGASETEQIRVIGVIADAHFESLYDPVLPSVFRRTESSVGGAVTLDIASGNREATLASIEKVWNEVIPQWPFEYEFLDNIIEAQYVKEERLASAVQYFTLLAIFIACLGLFGLASFSVQERTKEIGVRKVLGASIMSLFGMVSKKFVGLVVISFLLSIPLGYYLFDQWLQDFAYRINIGAGVFLVAGLASVSIAALAVGSQSLRAATMNPVKTLRHE